MSTCISRAGEYSDHESGDWCPRCGEFNEAAIVAQRDALRAEVERLRARVSDEPGECVMTHTPPFDFAQCETHDETFPLGGACRFHGRTSVAEVYADEADQMRARAVLAEAEVARLTAEAQERDEEAQERDEEAIRRAEAPLTVAARSTSAPAPSALSMSTENAIAALSEWGVGEGDVAAIREAVVEAAAWKLIDRTSDLADRGPSDETVQAALTAARAALPLLTAAPSATRDEVAEALGVVWDDGNGTGLDGWVGPGRGAGEVDHEAVRARDRAVDRALRVIAAAPSATRDEVARTITLTPIDVDLEALAAYFEGVTDEMVLRVRRNPDPKEDR